MSDFLHQFLTYSQYVAPLMANFDTRLGKESFIHYADNGEWIFDDVSETPVNLNLHCLD